MIKAKQKYLIFNDDIHRITFYVSIAKNNTLQNKKDFISWFNKKSQQKIEFDNYEFNGCFIASEERNRDLGLYLGYFKSGLIAHEVTHAINHVLNLLRIDMSNNNEFASDYNEWLTVKIVDLGYKK